MRSGQQFRLWGGDHVVREWSGVLDHLLSFRFCDRVVGLS